MARKKHNIHYIYKTTCNVTGRWYIGMHSTSNEDDGYMGSGKRLRYSIRKYGIDNHTKEILEYCNTREILSNKERELVTKELIIDELCMNLIVGGEGGRGWTKEEAKKGREKTDEILKEKYGENFKTTIIKDYHDSLSPQEKEIRYKNIVKTKKENNISFASFLGKSHTDDTKNKMRETMKGKYDGENHPQYGSCWITKDGENKKIKKEYLNNWLIEGWVKGRVIK